MRLLFTLSIVALLAGATEAVTITDSDPSMVWKISDADSSVFVMGSIHLGHRDYVQPRNVYLAYADLADELVFEADITDTAAIEAATLRHAYYTDSRRLAHDLSPTTISRLKTFLAREGLAYNDRLRPWIYQSLLLDRQLAQSPVLHANGIDAYFLYRAINRGQTNLGFLETIDYQVELFAQQPVAEVEASLNELLLNPDALFGEAEKLFSAWVRSDVASILQYIDADVSGNSGGDSLAVAERTRNWMPAIRASLAANRRPLYIVGAAHVLGPEGLLALFAGEGFTVERLPEPPRVSLALTRLSTESVLLTVNGSIGYPVALHSAPDPRQLDDSFPRTLFMSEEQITTEVHLRSKRTQFYQVRIAEQTMEWEPN
ncbi:MAG: TraB/GumN family protein [Opitutales bacterium]